MKTKGLLRGCKFNRTHQTYIEAAIPYITAWKTLPDVTKVALGIIEPCGPGQMRVKYQLFDHAIRARIRGQTAIQTFWIYGKNLTELFRLLEVEHG
jgi:hypothetical protein